MLEVIEKQCLSNSDRVAYISSKGSITYKELRDKTQKLASYLKKQGVSPVIVYGHKKPNMLISFLACLISNRAYIPCDIFLPKARIESIIDIAGATLLIKTESIDIDKIESIDDIELIDNENTLVVDSKNDTAYIIFTSGSTGEPKGVPISKNNLLNFTRWISELKPLCEYKDIVVLNQASFSFDLSVADIYYSLYNGHTIYALDKEMQKDYELLMNNIKKSEATVAVMTPTFAKLCLCDNTFNSEHLPNLKCIYLCGEMLEVPTAKKLLTNFPNLNIINAYGPTEATCAVSAINIDSTMLDDKILPVGDMNNLATPIEINNDEIVIKGASVFAGYLNNFIGGYYKEQEVNCFATGDIGYIEDNLLYCKGRKDNQLKYKGYRVELGEIEARINQIAGIKENAVIAKKDNNGIVKAIVAFVVLKDNGLTAKEITGELKRYLPEYMVPKVINIINEIPVNNNDKYDRKALENYDRY